MAKARKEIDKESMYQKIMPSSIRTAAAEEETSPAAAPKKAPAPRAKKPTAAAAPRPRPRPAALPDEDELPEETAPRGSMPTASIPAPQPAPAAATQATVINIMERLIEDKIGNAMEKFKCCTCPICRLDVAAFALNKLHPKYIVNEPELLEDALADKESNTQVTTALVQAILKIKSNPNH